VKALALVCLVALAGCQSTDFATLLEDVKQNCHTTIDAQIAGGLTGMNGQGHFQQECWPTGVVPTTSSTVERSTAAPAVVAAP
jgi:hypothetical protein